jgi:uncharacterized protein (TIGR02246 family)
MQRGIATAIAFVIASPASATQIAAPPTANAPPAGSVTVPTPPLRGAVALSAEDELAIMRLAARYWWAVDTNDADAFVSTFTEDGVFVHPTRTSQGSQAIRDWLAWSAENRRGPSGRLSTRHQSVNHMIRMTGPDTAVMNSYMLVTRIESLGAIEAPYLTSHGVLSDQLRRVNGEWKFVRREQSDQVLMRREAERGR